MNLKDKNIILGVTGSIAAYKACDIVSRLIKLGANVHVLMTENAKRFVSPLTFSSLTNHNVYDMWEDHEYKIEHIALAKLADLVLVAPATANIIAKIAHGIADDLLTTTVLATKAPVIIAPAMNTAMLENSITEDNIKYLLSKGFNFIDSDEGRLACGDVGKGKLASVDRIIEYLQTFESLINEPPLGGLRGAKRPWGGRPNESSLDLLGKQIIVSAGSTIAPIDPVRYISNHSSGKMGYAIAEAALKRGARVFLVAGNTAIDCSEDIHLYRVKTNEDMLRTVKDIIENNNIYCYISAAAPCDFKVKDVFGSKIKKKDQISLDLVKDIDILKEISKMPNKPKLIGFAAETDNLEEYAKVKLQEKKLDMIVANDVSGGKVFGEDSNKATFIFEDGRKIETDRIPKTELANIILDNIN